MLFWFVGAAVVIIWFVFTDPYFDYRLLPIGAVAPGLLELPFGGARALHSLTVSALLLAVVVIATSRHSPRRKLWMGLPLGTLLHLVLTGAWTSGEVFWWPFFGLGFDGATHPILGRGAWNILLEALGVAMCVWVWRSAELERGDRRAEFVRSGRLHLPAR